jgi:hypothetical protein
MVASCGVQWSFCHHCKCLTPRHPKWNLTIQYSIKISTCIIHNSHENLCNILDAVGYQALPTLSLRSPRIVSRIAAIVTAVAPSSLLWQICCEAVAVGRGGATSLTYRSEGGGGLAILGVAQVRQRQRQRASSRHATGPPNRKTPKSVSLTWNFTH